MPFSASRILIYDIIIYFMSRLARSAGGFFTFHLFNYTLLLTTQSFFRLIGLFCSDFNVAFRVTVFFFPNLVIYVGYMVPLDQMKRWLFWIVSRRAIRVVMLRLTNTCRSSTSTRLPMVILNPFILANFVMFVVCISVGWMHGKRVHANYGMSYSILMFKITFSSHLQQS
jgi:ABC-2 type transporter